MLHMCSTLILRTCELLLVKCFPHPVWSCDVLLWTVQLSKSECLYTSVDLCWCSDSSVLYCKIWNDLILFNTVFVFFCTPVIYFILPYTTTCWILVSIWSEYVDWIIYNSITESRPGCNSVTLLYNQYSFWCVIVSIVTRGLYGGWLI